MCYQTACIKFLVELKTSLIMEKTHLITTYCHFCGKEKKSEIKYPFYLNTYSLKCADAHKHFLNVPSYPL